MSGPVQRHRPKLAAPLAPAGRRGPSCLATFGGALSWLLWASSPLRAAATGRGPLGLGVGLSPPGGRSPGRGAAGDGAGELGVGPGLGGSGGRPGGPWATAGDGASPFGRRVRDNVDVALRGLEAAATDGDVRWIGARARPARAPAGQPPAAGAHGLLAAVDGTARPSAVLEPDVPETLRQPLVWRQVAGPLLPAGRPLTPGDFVARGDGDRELAAAAAAIAAYQPARLSALLRADGDGVVAHLPLTGGGSAQVRLDGALPCAPHGQPFRATADGALFFARLDAMRRRLRAAPGDLFPGGLAQALARLTGRPVPARHGVGLDVAGALAMAEARLGAPIGALIVHGGPRRGHPSPDQARRLAERGLRFTAFDLPLAIVGHAAGGIAEPARLALRQPALPADAPPTWVDLDFLRESALTLAVPT